MADEHRLHPAAMIFKFGAISKDFLLPALAVFVGGRGGGRDWLDLALLAVLIVPAAVGAVLEYLTFRYRYDADEVVIRSGIVFRNVRHIPYERIQNVDAVQQVVHRIFGVVEVRLETGSGSKAEASLKAVHRSVVGEMRRRMFASPDRGTEVVDRADDARDETLLRLSAGDALVAGLVLNRGYLVILAGLGVLLEFGPADLARRIASLPLATQLEPILRSEGIGATRGGTVILGIAAFGLVLVLLRVVGGLVLAVRLHGFTLTRSGNDLHVVHGLVTRVARTIVCDRIQRVIVHDGLVHRLTGRASIQVVTTGQSAAARSEMTWLAPLVPNRDVNQFLEWIGMPAGSIVWKRPHSSIGPRRIRGALVIAAIPAVAAGALGGIEWGTGVMIVAGGWLLLQAVLFARHLAWGRSDQLVAVRRGGIRRRTVISWSDRIQVVAVTESPFDRRATTATLHADTAGKGGPSLVIPYLPEAAAQALRKSIGLAISMRPAVVIAGSVPPR